LDRDFADRNSTRILINAMAATTPDPGANADKLRRTFGLLTAATLVVFGAIVFGQALRLRQPLRDEVLRREAESVHAVAQMQIAAAKSRLTKLGLELSPADLFAAVLESSRLNGVLAVQLFDQSSVLRESLPPMAPGGRPQTPWWQNPLPRPIAQLHRNGSLEEIFSIEPETGTEPTRVPLLEVIAPLASQAGGEFLGTARYWMTGDATDAELQHLDHSLFAQAAIAFCAGGAVIGLLMAWTYRRLFAARRQLVEQSSDLHRANEELDFAAKTAALGAISAHLIHGLKNPLAGLEGFVTESGATENAPTDPASRQTAMETARRLRTLVNDVVAVLRDETGGAADYAVPVAEVVDAAEVRTRTFAATAGVSLITDIAAEAKVSARTANLAGLVLANLLTNAIEASRRAGTVRLEVRSRTDQVEFFVVDQGPGLPEAVKAALFRPLKSNKPGGGGIGLAISHRLARHAGGELTVLNSGQSGTTFRLTVPAVA
jgi:signal transduction histidine kinase